MRKNYSKKLSYDDFHKKISRNEISPVYIFTGDQTYLMDQAVAELKKRALGTSADFNFSLFYGDSASAQEIIDTAKTYPMLSRMRLVVVKNAEKLSLNELKSLESYCSFPSPFTCLVLMLREEKKLASENTKEVFFVNFALDAKDMNEAIRDEVRKLGYDITKEAADTLVSLIGDNLQDIHAELQKLSLFIGDRKKIESEDVEKLTEKMQFEGVFELMNALAEKDKKKALKALLELQLTSEDPIAIINKISWRFRLIWRAKELLDKNTPQEVILRELKVSSGVLYYIRRQAYNLSYEDIKRTLSVLYEGDRKLKTAYIPKNMALTKLVLELCG
jgi:DNA polymerase-3 subunit delta